MNSKFHNYTPDIKLRRRLAGKKDAYTQHVSELQYGNYDVPESSLKVAGDTKYQNAILRELKKFGRVKHVLLIGIGGSNLGTESVYQALAQKTSPVLHVLEAIEPERLREFEGFIAQVEQLEEIAVVVISKSGTTTETMLNTAKVFEIGEQKFGQQFYSRVIFVGDKDTPFWKLGKKKKILCIGVPSHIGGRYSVFTAVGMVPLALLGIDVKSLRDGSIAATKTEALQVTAEAAFSIVDMAYQGVHVVNFFTFNERLHAVGRWYRQLLAESIGKSMTKKKTTFAHQLLPVVTSSADLHSMGQLYLGGYKNCFTHFVTYDDAHPYHLASDHWSMAHMTFLKGKDVRVVKNAITQGTLQAYDDQKLPYSCTVLQKCTAFEIGFLLTSLMYEVMSIGNLFDVNAFDQPNVESYKKHMRSHLN